MYKNMTLQQGIYNFIEEAKKIKSGLQGACCGIKEIDNAIQGFRKGEVTFIVNTTLRNSIVQKFDKSIMLGIADKLSQNEDGNLLWIAGDNNFSHYKNILKSDFCDAKKIKNLDINELEKEVKKYKHYPIETYHNFEYSFKQIEKIIKNASMSEVVYIEEYFLIERNKKKKNIDEYIVKKLKEMAEKYQVHIICKKYVSIRKKNYFNIQDVFSKNLKPFNYIDNVIEIEDPYFSVWRDFYKKGKKKKDKNFTEEWKNKLKVYVVKSNYFNFYFVMELNNC